MPDRPTTRLLVVRHGETAWNRASRFQGHLDSPLTERGVAQARAACEALRRQAIGACYSSDLGRAMETARIISAPHGLEVRTDARLRERDYGNFEGRTKDEIQRDDPEAWARHVSEDPDHAMVGGESARSLFDRVIDGVEDLARQHPGQTILVVAHGGVVGCLFRRAVGLDLARPRRYGLENGGVSVFTVADSWRLNAWNVLHLGDHGGA